MGRASLPPLLAIAANSSWSLFNFRKNLLLELQRRGFRIAALVPMDDQADLLRSLGVEVHPIELSSRGVSIGADLKLLMQFWRIFGRLRPAAYFGYTIKPNIYGSLAAQARGIPVINNITGLGTGFVKPGILQHIISALYRLSLWRSRKAFFLNSHDLDLFLSRGLVKVAQAELLPGEGIDLDRFRPQERTTAGDFTFLLASRLIWEKGIGEYTAAARQLLREGRRMRFQLLGVLDPSDPSAIRASDIAAWEKEGIITYLGGTSDVRPHIAACDCLVLPSWYPEGLPRVLMEGAAMERPLITTDTPGCREAVDDGKTGFLCAPKSVDSLAQAMARMASMPEDERRAMGVAGRAKMKRSFSEQVVIDSYLSALDSILAPPGQPLR